MLYRNIFFANYGTPVTLISDNGSEFINELMDKVTKFFNINKVEITAYHPNSNGLVERVNKELMALLRMYTQNENSVSWHNFLPTFQLQLNSTFNEALGDTPFFCLFGFDSRHISDTDEKFTYSDDQVENHLSHQRKIRKFLRENLITKNKKVISACNKNRKDKVIS